jgi:4-hydroxy-4-methyl-2-oxoglutarate aldolase
VTAVTVEESTLAELRTFDTPTLANALDTLDRRPANSGFTRPPVHCVLPGLPPMVGFAVTVVMCSEQPFESAEDRRDAMLPLYGAVSSVRVPQVIVVEDREQGAGCLWGEVNATICHRLGAEGVVTDGLVRDLPAVEALGFRYLARGVGVARSNTRVIETNGTVEVGSVRFEPGDLVHADRHGALHIPIDLVDDLLVAARHVVAREARLLDWVRSDDFRLDEIAARRAQR